MSRPRSRALAGILALFGGLACQPLVTPSDAGARLDAGAQADAGAVDAGAVDAGAVDAGAGDAGAPTDGGSSLRVLLFTKTTGFRHASIAVAAPALATLDAGWVTRQTEDTNELAAALGSTDVLVFLLTTGDVLDAPTRTAMESWVRGGGGWVGVHSAADTEYAWPFYGALVGAYFAQHPAVQAATLTREPGGVATAHLPSPWTHTDEWYDFQQNPRGAVTVELVVDEASYQGGQMGADHPLAWRHELDAGRAYYTGLGHTDESWSDALVLEHVRRAIDWAGKR